MKQGCLWLVVVLLVCLFVGCDTQKAVPDTDNPIDAVLMQDGQCLYTIVRSADASESLVRAMIDFNKAINTKTGTTLPISTDSDAPADGAKEILIGDTNRPETAAVREQLPKNGYAVTIQNDQVVILGTDDYALMLGLHAFYDNVVRNQEQAGYLSMSADDIAIHPVDENILLSDVITMGGKVQTECEYRFAIELPNEELQTTYHVAQGAASDGTFGYFLQRNADDSGTVIAKYRMEDAALVATSSVLALGHGNGMAYDPKRDCLLVTDGIRQTNVLWFVDPDTLTVTETIKLPKTAQGIAVHPSTGDYVIHTRNDFWVLDGDFQVKTSCSRKNVESSYGTQSVWADERYIYFPMSGKKSKGKTDCILEVYDWDGNYVTRVTVPVAEEIEALFMANGRYYANFNRTGDSVDEVYELTKFSLASFVVKDRIDEQ